MDLSGHPSCRSAMLSLCLYLDLAVDEINRSISRIDVSARETDTGSIITIKTSNPRMRNGYSATIVRVVEGGIVTYSVKEPLPFLVNLVPSDRILEMWVTNLLKECVENYPPSSGFDIVYSIHDKIETVTPIK